MLLSFCLPLYQCVCLSVFFSIQSSFSETETECPLKENRLYISYWLAYRKLTSEIWAISQVVSGLSVTAHAYHTRFQEIHLRTQLPFANDDVTFQIDFKLELGYYSGHKVRVCVEEKRYGAHEVSAVVIDNWLPKEKSVKSLGKHDGVKRTCKKNCKGHYNESIKSTKVKFLGSMIVTFTVLVVRNCKYNAASRCLTLLIRLINRCGKQGYKRES